MDNRNNAIPFDKITARDITDTHRRGLAMAAALQFGLASELWAGNMGETLTARSKLSPFHHPSRSRYEQVIKRIRHRIA